MALCPLHMGCIWSGGSRDGKCIGVPRACSERTVVCDVFAGDGCLHENARCDGSAVPCEGLSAAAMCTAQVGCVWGDDPTGAAGNAGTAGNSGGAGSAGSAGSAGTSGGGAGAGTGSAGSGAAGSASAGASGTAGVGAAGVQGTAGVGAAGAAGAAMLTTPMRDHTFGTLYKGRTGIAWTASIVNSGTAPTGALKTKFAGGATVDFTVVSDSCAGATLAAGAKCEVVLNAQPVTAGVREAFFDIVGAPGGTVDLYLRADVNSLPVLVFDPFVQDFGKQPVLTTSAPATLTVNNHGGLTPAPPVVTLTGAAAAAFKITSNQCVAPLDFGQSCTIQVAFAAPAPAGYREATLSASSLETEALASLRGTATSTLTVTKSGTDTGAYQFFADPVGLVCPYTCTFEYAVPSVTLTLTASVDGKISSITGCTGPATACVVPLDKATKSVNVVIDAVP